MNNSGNEVRKIILIPIEAGGLKFRNPFIVGSGPTTKKLSQLLEAERTGWGGISVKLTMDPDPYVNPKPRYRWFSKKGFHIFTSETRLTLAQGLKLVEEGRKKTKEIIIFANPAYFGDRGLSGWQDMSKKLENAGAHALELNLCCPNMSFSRDMLGIEGKDTPRSGASLGSDPQIVGAIVKAVVSAVDIPVFAKVTPEGCNIGEVAKAAINNGAVGISSVGNQTGMPPFDINDMEKGTYRLQKGFSLGCMSGPWLKPLAQKDVFKIRKAIGPEPAVVGLGGVQNYVDAIEMAMVGADLIGICTETMLRGFAILPEIVTRTKDYMEKRKFSSFRQIRDKMLPYIQTAQDLESLPGYAVVNPELCTGCGRCIKIGYCDAIKMVEKIAVIDKEKCLACSTCTDVCPKNAIQMVESENPLRS